jgi:hypothetical protein
MKSGGGILNYTKFEDFSPPRKAGLEMTKGKTKKLIRGNPFNPWSIKMRE